MADDISAAARIFCELATRLRASPLNSLPVNTATERSLPVNTENSTSTPVIAATASTSSTHRELQTLFPHHFASTYGSTSTNKNRSSSRKRKRNDQQNSTNSKTKVKSLTRKFVCLADQEQAETPDREEQRELLVAGLGEVKVAVPEDAAEKDIRELLIKTFPKLRESGGFELMYVETRCKDLLVIPLGPDGLSMKYLASFIGQGKIYIRPIQQDLPLNEDAPSVATQKEECRNCHAMVDLISLRDHYTLCSKNDSEDDVGQSVLETLAFDTYSRNSANDVDDSILERSAFDTYSLNTGNDPDVLPEQPLCTSNITPQKTNNEEYENYCEILDDTLSDDDPELLEAIEASLSELTKQQHAQGEGSILENEEDSLKSLLGSFQNNNLDLTGSEKNGSITISRKAVFCSAQKAIARKKFSFLKPVCVTFAGEEAADEGGPKREFFRLLMCAICESSIFHGSWFSHDLGLLADNKYHLAGKLVAWSVLQGGSGPRCLSSVGYDLQRGVAVSHEAAIKSVPDHEMKEILEEAVTCSTEERFSSVVRKYGDKIAQYGYPKIYISNLQDRDDMVESLLKQCFLYGVHAEVSQFFEGLNSIGKLGDMILDNKLLFDALLGNQHPQLTKAVFMSLYELCRSEEGSNKRDKEDSTIYCFELFLQDLEEGEVGELTLEHLLVFITGADCVPPLGFDKLITIDFYDFVENVRRRPYASTCGLYLFLPRGFEDPSEFSNFMNEALMDCHGFGKG